VTSSPPPLPGLTELARRYGVQPSFVGTDGREHRAEDAVILSLLAALGAPVASGADVAGALAERRLAEGRDPLPPVVVQRVGTAASAEVTVPERVHPRDVWCTVELEDGEVRRQRLIDTVIGMHALRAAGATPGNRYRFALDRHGVGPIGPGYHRLVVEWPGARASALLIAAPLCPPASRGWGLFLPLHAVRTERDWGVGSYADMGELGEWVAEMGASMLGALPLYPAYLDPPADPSPYLPVSRLAYNEVFVDPTVLPELAAAPEARRLLQADEFVRRLSSARDSTLVDYETVSALRRQVLTPMAEALLAAPSPRRDAFCAWVDAHPELAAYARFRAAGDRLGHGPGAHAHAPFVDQDSEPTLGYHLYAQWAAAQQLTAAAAAVPLYADLPVGVHPDGFDPVWAPGAFALGVHGGAPPDVFFSGGQDWAFPPLHPERMRDDGYHYFIGVLRRAVRHAAYLRVDHIMGLQRLYWIPEGFDARHGAYVSYRADELFAVVALEAHRAGTVVVGEDLGTVPDGLRGRMADDRMLRSFVLQFESTAANPLPPAPPDVLASWGTHDLPRFLTYFSGHDIDERARDGQLSTADAAAERTGRARWRAALLRALGDDDGANDEGDDAEDGAEDAVADGDDERSVPALALRGCLLHLASGAADLVLIDLEDLWGEREPQNRPGTGAGGANWRRRGTRTLSEARADTATTEFLRAVNRVREGGPAAAPAPSPSERVEALR
jgi:4-alpha-glucanotransferase